MQLHEPVRNLAIMRQLATTQIESAQIPHHHTGLILLGLKTLSLTEARNHVNQELGNWNDRVLQMSQLTVQKL
ncbi:MULTISPECIES: hypothetical protein [Anabaena]|uniref:Uncharacterized protein n=1 Tax=Anabaena catenula FACHB-362 TaxID=2692877 RepID=A0ABR8JCI4_9NOST|nr:MULTISPECIES: hypothetical protein [Anabaena]MBD2695257.1 hypothetical protein [Anabaena catenula FACHB-362]